MSFNRKLDPAKVSTRGAIIISGRIQFAGGTTTPDVIEGAGIQSAVHAGSAGLYDIVLRGLGLGRIESVHVTPETPGNDLVACTVQTVTEATRTIRIRWLAESAGTLAAANADDNDAVNILVIAQNTTLTR